MADTQEQVDAVLDDADSTAPQPEDAAVEQTDDRPDSAAPQPEDAPAEKADDSPDSAAPQPEDAQAGDGDSPDSTGLQPEDAAAEPTDESPDPVAPQPEDAQTELAVPPDVDDYTAQRVFEIGVPLRVVLAERKMRMQQILRISLGSIIEFEKAFDEELDLIANNRCIAFGQAVKTGENFGIRVTRIADMNARIDALGPKG